ncbi:MAG: urease accessory protein UreE [Porticoccaceae bacterium]
MKKILQFVPQTEAVAQVTLRLPYDVRKKSRFKAESTEGEGFGVMLPRGRVLRDGDQLLDDSGRIVAVQAAPENLSIAAADDPCLLARAAYHLGNRHVPLQIGTGWLRYQHDHVLDAMVVGLGLHVSVEALPFEPEDGAYASGEGAHSGHHHVDDDRDHSHHAHHEHDH